MARTRSLGLLVVLAAMLSGAVGMRLWLSEGDIIWAVSGQKSPKEFTEYYAERREFLRRRAGHVADGAVLFIGDSRFDSLNVSAVLAGAENFGIGSETSERLLARLSDYAPFSRWNYIVLCVGFNDAKFREPAAAMANVRSIVDRVAGQAPIFLIAILPADETVSRPKPNTYISRLNELLEHYAAETDFVDFVDARNGLVSGEALLASVHIGDGVHLNHQGQEIFIGNLRRLLPGVGP